MIYFFAVLLAWAAGHVLWRLDHARLMRSVYGAARSGKWRSVERHFLALHPNCEACGGTQEVVGHHVEPFHLRPDKELDARNLIALCNKHGCHFTHGHCFDWQAHNPHVREDARVQLMRVNAREYE